jgi:hypothetical protein
MDMQFLKVEITDSLTNFGGQCRRKQKSAVKDMTPSAEL